MVCRVSLCCGLFSCACGVVGFVVLVRCGLVLFVLFILFSVCLLWFVCCCVCRGGCVVWFVHIMICCFVSACVVCWCVCVLGVLCVLCDVVCVCDFVCV